MKIIYKNLKQIYLQNIGFFICNEKREKIIKNFFIKETKKIFNEDEKRIYSLEDFKKLLLDSSKDGLSWIIERDLLIAKIEEYLIDQIF